MIQQSVRIVVLGLYREEFPLTACYSLSWSRSSCLVWNLMFHYRIH